jgi:hypothetical protein
MSVVNVAMYSDLPDPLSMLPSSIDSECCALHEWQYCESCGTARTEPLKIHFGPAVSFYTQGGNRSFAASAQFSDTHEESGHSRLDYGITFLLTEPRPEGASHPVSRDVWVKFLELDTSRVFINNPSLVSWACKYNLWTYSEQH